MTLASNRGAIERSVADADLVIGAVLVAGGRAPVVVSEDMVRGMKPQSVIVDVAIDQGGCIETIRETTHDEPVYELHGVIHYAVGNMPGAVPHTSTYALTNATLPYQLDVALLGAVGAARDDPAMALGINTAAGHVTNEPVAEVPRVPVRRSLGGPRRLTERASAASSPFGRGDVQSSHESNDGDVRVRARPAGARLRRWQQDVRRRGRDRRRGRGARVGSPATRSGSRCCTTTTSSPCFATSAGTARRAASSR